MSGEKWKARYTDKAEGTLGRLMHEFELKK